MAWPGSELLGATTTRMNLCSLGGPSGANPRSCSWVLALLAFCPHTCGCLSFSQVGPSWQHLQDSSLCRGLFPALLWVVPNYFHLSALPAVKPLTYTQAKTKSPSSPCLTQPVCPSVSTPSHPGRTALSTVCAPLPHAPAQRWG